MQDYITKDLEDALRRAFVEKKAETILVDGDILRDNFLRESVSLGIEKGWLEVKSKLEEEQWTTLFYGLTKTGRNYFGLE